MSASKDNTRLLVVLEDMLASDTTITARSVTRAPGAQLKNASDITRNAQRRALLSHFQDRQKAIRHLAQDNNKDSVANLQLKIARLEEECGRLRQSKDLLVASHKAMLLAVGEVGGMRAWVKLFPLWDEIRQTLDAMGAVPDQVVTSLSDRFAKKP